MNVLNPFLTPQGKTYLIRESEDASEKVVYAYAIDASRSSFEIELGDYSIKKYYNLPDDFKVENGKLYFTSGDCKMWGTVLHFVKK